MFSGNSALLVVVLSSLSLAQAAGDNPPNPAGPTIPACAANCMSIKIKEAAAWFGQSAVSSYCTASSQAGDASAISSSSALLFTAISSCAFSLFL
ncbi:uncharacterized protein PGTG_21286 [Puccinia graminis f. sp. tritici CRL 75-36-700-3]|uniref:Extracellular membrane protein CFEM domain-containing protein n=1 Tax=Puccinia graminis f. sp. tritici (strain CRL 75-36-700-3 / race SCCL) TaxID=418459 RepID=H6QQX4_PUCGT|nr:uncharacterized protein PGTG_21286 [Puccinia graminis f. sp. tritici CRL 75-36-700-3]EHS62937.1 hypothetical protein PGTG_21286 [Puccinia graminis f. sp. tritici CRL 75-36-700-3]